MNAARVFFMRGFRYLARNWQPIAVVAGAMLGIFGAALTTYGLTNWLIPAAGIWPAVSVFGVLGCRAAFRWGGMTVIEESDE